MAKVNVPDGAMNGRNGSLNGRGSGGAPVALAAPAPPSPMIVETIVSHFHCLYQDALHFHTQSRLAVARSEAEASRLARAALVLYLGAAESLVHQAAVELGRPELSPLLADPSRPMPLSDAWRLLPAIVAEGPTAHNGRFDPTLPPWPQFAELLALRASWAYPGPPSQRRAYHAQGPDGDFEPLDPRDLPADLGVAPHQLQLPKTGLPRDPYALRPHHLDTARAVLDSAISALDKRMEGALLGENRHKREPNRALRP